MRFVKEICFTCTNLGAVEVEEDVLGVIEAGEDVLGGVQHGEIIPGDLEVGEVNRVERG